jgi:uncharacterized protein
VDSIALTYSLLDPILTVLRPVTALVTGVFAGIVENLFGEDYRKDSSAADRTCPVDACCDGIDCPPEVHAYHHTWWEKFRASFNYAFNDLMSDLAGWFALGMVLAGLITVLLPDNFFESEMGTGLWAYLGVMAVSLPMYICASMSTPVAAALVLKGMSPGCAMVLLMAGPASNVATMTMVLGLLGKRTLAVYLGSIVVVTLCVAFFTDFLYSALGLSAKAMAGASAGEFFPFWLEFAAACFLGFLMLRTGVEKLKARFRDRLTKAHHDDHHVHSHEGSSCCSHNHGGGT